jgi:uncharacterized protein YegP (UPF0339 family)
MNDERKLELYQDKAGEWRWRRVAKNGEVVADSGEGYTRKSDAVEAARREFPYDFVTFAVSAERR